ncbi:MAG: DUF721 domain-containing protein [bacterium]
MAVFKYPRYARKNPAVIADGGVSISSMVGSLVSSLKLDEQGRMGVLIEKWSTAVGSGIAAHTRPGRLTNKELTIYVDSSPWLSELQRCAKKELLAKLQSVFGRDVIQTIRLSMDPGEG